MHKRITDGRVIEGLGRLYIGSLPIDMGPTNVGDTVVIKPDEDIDYYVKVESIEEGDLYGTLVAIGRIPGIAHGGFTRGDKVVVSDALVSAVHRAE